MKISALQTGKRYQRNQEEYTRLHAQVDQLISIRLDTTYLVELKNTLLQKNLKSVNADFNILPIALILIDLRFW